MPTAYSEFITTSGNVLAAVKAAILASSDWAAITSGPAPTALTSAGTAFSTTTWSVASTTGFLVGDAPYFQFTDGTFATFSTQPTITAINSATSVTLSNALTSATAIGTLMGVNRGNIVKATTTRGAQMVLDLTDAAPQRQGLSMACYRTHNGTVGVDKTTRFLSWSSSTGVTLTDPVRVFVSAGKEHLFICCRGAFPGEVSASISPVTQSLFLGDIVPYHSADAVPAVVLAAATVLTQSAGIANARYAAVSRNQADTTSWVRANLLTLTRPGTSSGSANDWSQFHHRSLASDGKHYLLPWVVEEVDAGLRGRVAKALYGGSGMVSASVDTTALALGTDYAIGSETYRLVPVWAGIASTPGPSPWGEHGAFRDVLLAVPRA